MDQAVASGLWALLGTCVGGLLSFLLSRQQFAQQLAILKETNKVDTMAEAAARHYLSHESYTDRSFEVMRKHLGGFEDDELRRILVRAGAIRIYRDDGSEWWRLLSRSEEHGRLLDSRKAAAPDT